MSIFNEQITVANIKLISQIKRILSLIVGTLLLAISFNIFLFPNEIVSGGLSGLSITIFKTLNISPSIFIFYCSIFLLLCSLLLLGKEKTINSIAGSLIFPILMKLTENIGDYILLDEQNILLATIFGGLFNGIGLGLIFKNGFTTGGVDIINQIMHKYLKMSIGQSMIIIDGLILFISSFILGAEIILYGFTVIYIMSIIADKVILGISNDKFFYIITSEEEKMKKAILNNLSYRLTILDAYGGTVENQKKILMCVIPTKDYFKIKEIITQVDDTAFYVVTNSYEVFTSNKERMKKWKY